MIDRNPNFDYHDHDATQSELVKLLATYELTGYLDACLEYDRTRTAALLGMAVAHIVNSQSGIVGIPRADRRQVMNTADLQTWIDELTDDAERYTADAKRYTARAAYLTERLNND